MVVIGDAIDFRIPNKPSTAEVAASVENPRIKDLGVLCVFDG
jgi:hypothetical protein